MRLLTASTTTLVAFATSVSAQTPLHLENPDATFPEPFSRIAGLRELSDGRVIVGDPLEKAIRVLDFRGGDFTEIGRAGSGPGEFQTPGRLLPLPGDSTLLLDFGNMRMTVVSAGGRFARTAPLRHETGPFMMAAATDREGFVYVDQSSTFAFGPNQPEPSDSGPLLRWKPGAPTFDTVAMLPRPLRSGAGRSVQISGSAGGAVRLGGGIAAMPFSPRDAWAAGPDGRIALISAADYHVEWLLPDGRRVAGRPVPYRPVPITTADKEAWADEQAGRQMTMVTTEGSRTMRPDRPDVDGIEWPEHKPPFVNNAWVASNGELWVQRHVRHGVPETYDVFDASGNLARQVVLPEHRDVVGHGNGTLYAVRTDGDGLQWLEKYELQ